MAEQIRKDWLIGALWLITMAMGGGWASKVSAQQDETNRILQATLENQSAMKQENLDMQRRVQWMQDRIDEYLYGIRTSGAK